MPNSILHGEKHIFWKIQRRNKIRRDHKLSAMATYLFIYYYHYYFPIKLNNVFLFQSYDNGLAQGAGLESHGKTS